MTVNSDIVSEVPRREVSICADIVRLFNEDNMRTEIVNVVVYLLPSSRGQLYKLELEFYQKKDRQ